MLLNKKNYKFFFKRDVEKIINRIAPIELTELEYLKNLLKSEKWPPAAESHQICNFSIETEKLQRAENILNLFGLHDLSGKRVLDFGCGEGHLLIKAKEKGAESCACYDSSLCVFTNYDAINDFNDKKTFFTSNWDKVKRDVETNGKYDIIILYDVFDHLSVSWDEALKNISDASCGLVYMRCHPFCSRHGGHFYNQLNKAFIQLIFDCNELASLGLTAEVNYRAILDPISIYLVLLKKYFTILEQDIIKTEVDKIFIEDKIIQKRIMEFWYKNDMETQNNMSISFVDFVLKPN